MPKEQHEQMCDLRKKSWTQSPVEIDVFKNKSTYKSSDISRTITRFSSSTSSPNLPTFPRTSFSAKISMLSWCTPTHTLIHTKKKMQPCRIGVSVLQLGGFFCRKSFDCWSQITDQSSAPFWQESKNYIPISSSLKNPETLEIVQKLNWHSKFICTLHANACLSKWCIRSYLVYKLNYCMCIYVIHSNTFLIRTIYYFCSYPKKKT